MSWRGSGNFRGSGSSKDSGRSGGTDGSVFSGGSAGGPPLLYLIGAAVGVGVIALIVVIAVGASRGGQTVAVAPAAATATPVAPAATATPAAPAAAQPTLAPVTISAADAGAATNSGDPVSGAALFGAMPSEALLAGAVNCSSCHNIAVGSGTLVGPTLSGIAKTAETRIPGMNAVQYIRSSIVNPKGYVVQGFTPGIMPQTFAKALTPAQIEDLVAYLLTLP
jgi:mono/diheme cytochrome c family protein